MDSYSKENPVLTTKNTKYTKVRKFCFLNFVLFVSFVVKLIFDFSLLLPNREIFVQPFLDDVGQARILFVEGEVIDIGQ